MKSGYFKLEKYVSFILSVVLCLTAFAVFYNLKGGGKQVALYPFADYLVVIDAGHGGIDGGVEGVKSGVKESEINLAIALKLERVFVHSGVRVVMTRKSSGGLYGSLSAGHKKRDMQARAKIIKENSPTLLISIHQNQFSSEQRRGAQVFFKDGHNESKRLACVMQEHLNQVTDTGRHYSALVGDYYLLNVSPCTAVIVECGFLSNPQDEALLLTSEYQQELAKTIYSAVLQFLSEQKD